MMVQSARELFDDFKGAHPSKHGPGYEFEIFLAGLQAGQQREVDRAAIRAIQEKLGVAVG